MEAMPSSRILTESDGPFARIGPSQLTPYDVVKAEIALADLWKMQLNDVKRTLLDNFKNLLLK